MSFSELRKNMVQNQLIKRGIKDERVLSAMGSIPREIFVSDHLRNSAYDDSPLLIGNEQTISQPYIVAKMTELLEVKNDHIVLEIGTGSGYQAAVLSQLALRVFTIERITDLRKSSEANLKSMNITNVFVINGDGTIGLSQYAPFDRIMVTAAGPKIPKNLIDQMKDNSIIVMPVGDMKEQKLIRGVKAGGKFEIEEHDLCRFVPLLGKYGFSDVGV
ncbi:TPA: protein-L-isoaspartate O-methyltransferase, partial [candidate division WOR-3 bacterium]|jgi:protein-L-isoaspartate(D-aspartate) O-methyltransferase|nr:protein-L-isoaspartate O-methyltransferase [candidate division WOR-3 bacterium]